ncbi:hypothetical protein EZS27_028441 [termite gut metagenome]|uniref:Uncharacterized protein n=1 Tax=termite gut metagenome TaxID=433724 RepID=A0A5J4QKX0_9ZZZZ
MVDVFLIKEWLRINHAEAGITRPYICSKEAIQKWVASFLFHMPIISNNSDKIQNNSDTMPVLHVNTLRVSITVSATVLHVKERIDNSLQTAHVLHVIRA